MQAAICYTGDVFQGELGGRGRDYKYKLEYYLNLARQFVDAGTHILSVKVCACTRVCVHVCVRMRMLCSLHQCACARCVKGTVTASWDACTLPSHARVDGIGVQDMAGLLTPQSTRMLIGALRKEFPAMPIHVHTHDTLGTSARCTTRPKHTLHVARMLLYTSCALFMAAPK